MASVSKGHRALKIKTDRRGDAIIIAVEDSGPGIDPTKYGEIFDAFFTTKEHGMGLGLAICRLIVERHNGQLSVYPADPHGAIFCMALPRHIVN
jgi:signal transduction histidine kinase